MTRRYNPPPNWPKPPAGWTPGPGWKPDPSWGPAPAGWQLWIDTEKPLNIFISYRRSDCQSQANGLHDGLTHRLPDSTIFMDIDSIPAGVDFEQHIRAEINACDVVLVLIGDNWLDARPGSKTRRIDEPNDFVRLEVENALANPSVRTIPVLVEGASMPSASELPDSIQRLGRINAIDLDDMRWKSDLERLTRLLDSVKEERDKGRPLGGLEAAKVASVPRPQERSTPAPPPPASTTPPPPPPPVTRTPARPAMPPVSPAASRSTWQQFNSRPAAGFIFAILPIVSCGLLSFAPALRAGLLRPHLPKKRLQLILLGVGIEVVVFVAYGLTASGPEDESGTPTGPVTNFGVTLLFLTIIAAAIVGLILRNRPPELDAIEAEMHRRRTRDHYRQIAAGNPEMARSIHVGRPDLRALDDGGLVDLNTVSAQTLVQHAGLAGDDAQRVMEQRSIVGRFVSVEHAISVAELTGSGAEQLRELGVVT